jgi:hypothetical protein
MRNRSNFCGLHNAKLIRATELTFTKPLSNHFARDCDIRVIEMPNANSGSCVIAGGGPCPKHTKYSVKFLYYRVYNLQKTFLAGLLFL